MYPNPFPKEKKQSVQRFLIISKTFQNRAYKSLNISNECFRVIVQIRP